MTSHTFLEKRGILLIVGIFLIPLFAHFVAAQQPSVDAIAVYPREIGDQLQGDIYYSFFGHLPAIPQPVTTPLQWQWWTLDGNTVPSAAIPNPITGDDKYPSIAFSREGYAVAVWQNIRQIGTVLCDPDNSVAGDEYDDIVYQGNILYSVWNGLSWSSAAQAVPGSDDIILQDPAIAIDSSGKGILVFLDQTFMRGNNNCLTGAALASVKAVKFTLPNAFEDSSPLVLDGPYEVPTIFLTYANLQLSPEVAFTAKQAPANAFTRQEAVVTWWSYPPAKNYTKTCVPSVGDPYSIQIDTFWPKKARWNGNAFDQIDFIPDVPTPPQDLTANLSIVRGTKISLSPNQYLGVDIVWPITVQSGDPCGGPLLQEYEVWHARWNSTDWDRKGSKFAAGVTTGVSVAHLPDTNNAIAVYDDAGEGIKWTIGPVFGPWVNRGQIYSVGIDPAIASLAHNQTVAVWVLGNTIMWSNSTKPEIGWSASQTLDIGIKEPDIAAHTGSPTMPHAEWTFLAYLDADVSGIAGAVENDQEEMKTVGSTNLVNIVTQLDKIDPNIATRYYIKKNAAKELANFGAVDSGNVSTLRDFLTWTLEKYPAKRHHLVLNDHGGGWQGLCEDKSQRGWMHLSELDSALFAVNKKFDILTFDACMMAMLEVFYEIKDYAKLFVASEEVIKGAGSSYNKVLQHWVFNPFQTDEELTKKMVDIYKETYEGGFLGFGDEDTISVIDASRIQDLVNRVNVFAAVARVAVQSDNGANVIREVFYYDPAGGGNFFTTEADSFSWRYYKDLYDAATLIAQNHPDANVRNNAGRVKIGVQRAVLHHWEDSEHSKSRGISIYFEPHEMLYKDSYNLTDFAFDTDWNEFIKTTAGSTEIIIEFTGSSSNVFIQTTDNNGNVVGGVDQNDVRCGGFCQNTNPGATCTAIEGQTTILLPITSTGFTWTVNGSLLNPAPANYTLTITLNHNGQILKEEQFSGSVNPNESVTGQFVIDVNVPPALIKIIPDQIFEKNTSVSLNLSQHFFDANGEDIDWSSTQPENIMVSLDGEMGTVTLIPQTNFVGTRYITFTATDGISSTDSYPIMLLVYDDMPIAAADASSTQVAVGGSVTFDHSASTHGNPFGELVLFEWDFQRDGTYDFSTKNISEKPVFSYAAAGTYNATLRVTDDGVPQKTDVDGIQITVSAAANDADGDGITNAADTCPNTPAGASIDANGCSAAQFCTTFNPLTNAASKKACRFADWKSNEPKGNPHDCRPVKSGNVFVCVATANAD